MTWHPTSLRSDVRQRNGLIRAERLLHADVPLDRVWQLQIMWKHISVRGIRRRHGRREIDLRRRQRQGNAGVGGRRAETDSLKPRCGHLIVRVVVDTSTCAEDSLPAWVVSDRPGDAEARSKI